VNNLLLLGQLDTSPSNMRMYFADPLCSRTAISARLPDEMEAFLQAQPSTSVLWQRSPGVESEAVRFSPSGHRDPLAKLPVMGARGLMVVLLAVDQGGGDRNSPSWPERRRHGLR
jgi:hypothetical protein